MLMAKLQQFDNQVKQTCLETWPSAIVGQNVGCRMTVIQPAWRVYSTMVFRNTLGRHFYSSIALKTEPGRTDRLVTMSVCSIHRHVRGFSVRTGHGEELHKHENMIVMANFVEDIILIKRVLRWEYFSTCNFDEFM